MAGVNMMMLGSNIFAQFVVTALAAFIPAGTVAWTAGWVFVALHIGAQIAVCRWLVRHDPSLLWETTIGLQNRSQKRKPFFVVMQILFLGWLILMPLDAVRFGWSRVPLWLQVAGAALMLVSFYLTFLAFKARALWSQTVVATGPYRHVRHPMDAAAIIQLVGAALLLGSRYGLLGVPLLVGTIGVRAVKEERLLRAELPGYEEYLARVKYRFLPRVW